MYEEYCRDSHGVELLSMTRETTIKVDANSTLKLAPCLNIESQATDKIYNVIDSWFHSATHSAILSNTEGKANAMVQLAKSVDLLNGIKGSIGTLFYNNFSTRLSTKLDDQYDLIYGFTLNGKI